MDRTITVRGTYTPFLFHMVFARAPWRLVFLPILPFGFIAYGLKLISRGRLKTFNQQMLLGNGPELSLLQPHIERFVDKVLRSNHHKKAIEQVEADRADGRKLVLVTASYELYAEAIARRLGFDHLIGTQLMVDNEGRVLPQIIGENCYDDAKIGRIEALFASQGWQRSQSHVRAYSDHVSDQAMLEWADEAIATTPTPKLRHLAKQRGWKIVDWR
ncbi:HAD-IB family hydrolase [Parasphingorhabdus flavimaris]|uniref:HAD-IB family hydrolase n=2 Tax=Parasphingorhabdus flavimaris TaxID=266812 RepID=A0ABX2N474_9SPHN|nr:HAD-IB family hydrolase [Parasphingorhabdus flavimaris]